MNNPTRNMGNVVNHTSRGAVDVTPQGAPVAYARAQANELDPGNVRLAHGVSEAQSAAHRAILEIAGDEAAIAAGSAAALAWSSFGASYRILLQRVHVAYGEAQGTRPLPSSRFLAAATRLVFETLTADGARLDDPELAAIAGVRAYQAVEHLDCETTDRACVIAAALAGARAAAVVVATKPSPAAKSTAVAKAPSSEA